VPVRVFFSGPWATSTRLSRPKASLERANEREVSLQFLQRSVGLMPANVSLRALAMVAAGFKMTESEYEQLVAVAEQENRRFDSVADRQG